MTARGNTIDNSMLCLFFPLSRLYSIDFLSFPGKLTKSQKEINASRTRKITMLLNIIRYLVNLNCTRVNHLFELLKVRNKNLIIWTWGHNQREANTEEYIWIHLGTFGLLDTSGYIWIHLDDLDTSGYIWTSRYIWILSDNFYRHHSIHLGLH